MRRPQGFLEQSRAYNLSSCTTGLSRETARSSGGRFGREGRLSSISERVASYRKELPGGEWGEGSIKGDAQLRSARFARDVVANSTQRGVRQ